MAKNQNTIEKRRREIEKKRKAAEKRELRRKKKDKVDEQPIPDSPTDTDDTGDLEQASVLGDVERTKFDLGRIVS